MSSDASSPAPPPPPLSPLPALACDGQWEIKYGGRAPRGMKKLPAQGKGRMCVSGSGITLDWKYDREPYLALFGLLGMLLSRKTPEQATFHPAALLAAYDESHGRAAVQLPTGLWLSFRLLDKEPSARLAFGRMMETVYEDRLIRTKLPRLTGVDWGIIIILGGIPILILLFIIAGIISAELSGR